MNKKVLAVAMLPVLLSLTLTACNSAQKTTEAPKTAPVADVAASKDDSRIIEPHKNLNQAPVPVKVERTGKNQVNVEMTAQITDIEISKGQTYKAWTFNGEAPGPVIVVNEGDMINFTLKNMDPAIPHSMDFHAVHAAPSKKFIDVMPNETGTFQYPANRPGVFMYHCGTKPVLQHIANGMHGVIIVKPKNGYPTDKEVAKEFVLVQNEWYKYNDIQDMTTGTPSQVVFSAKALHPGDINTNGDTFSLKEKPLLAKVGEKVRIYINNVGPNQVSSFHVVGTILDDVYLDGNPHNHLKGMQTVMLPASGGAVVEFTPTEEGSYPIVTHQFNHVQLGASVILKVTADGKDDGQAAMSH